MENLANLIRILEGDEELFRCSAPKTASVVLEGLKLDGKLGKLFNSSRLRLLGDDILEAGCYVFEPVEAFQAGDKGEKESPVAPCSEHDTRGPYLSTSTPTLADTLNVADPDVKGSSSALQSLLDFDSNCSLWIHKMGLGFPRSLLQALEYSGDGLFWVPGTAAICLAPAFMAQSFFSSLFIGFLFDLLCIGTVKVLIRRPRPVYNKGMYLVVSVDHFSFPSGHSSRAFLILVFFLVHSSLWKDIICSFLRPSVGDMDNPSYVSVNFEVLVYPIIASMVALWAVATAFSRILLGRHYLLDVIAGSILGVTEAIFVLLALGIPFENHRHWLIGATHKLREAILTFV